MAYGLLKAWLKILFVFIINSIALNLRGFQKVHLFDGTCCWVEKGENRTGSAFPGRLLL